MSNCRYKRAFGNFEELIPKRNVQALTFTPIMLGPHVVILNVSSSNTNTNPINTWSHLKKSVRYCTSEISKQTYLN